MTLHSVAPGAGFEPATSCSRTGISPSVITHLASALSTELPGKILLGEELSVSLAAFLIGGEEHIGVNDALVGAELVLLLDLHLAGLNLLLDTLTAILLYSLYGNRHEQGAVNIVFLDTHREAVEEVNMLTYI